MLLPQRRLRLIHGTHSCNSSNLENRGLSLLCSMSWSQLQREGFCINQLQSEVARPSLLDLSFLHVGFQTQSVFSSTAFSVSFLFAFPLNSFRRGEGALSRLARTVDRTKNGQLKMPLVHTVEKACNYHLQAAGVPLFEEHRIGSIEGLANASKAASVSTHLLTESSISTCVSQKLQCHRKGL